MEINYSEIGLRIQKQRELLSLTQNDLSVLCNVSLGTIQAIESGRRGMSIETLVLISRHLNLSLDYIIFGITENNHKILIDSLNSIIGSIEKDQLIVLKSLISSLLDSVDLFIDKK